MSEMSEWTEHHAEWSAHNLVELSPAECLRLLSSKQVGRISFCVAAGEAPLVLPVNYTTKDGYVYFRTSPYNVMAGALKDMPASFQVDDIDEFLESGWSVLLKGHAEFLDPDAEKVAGVDRLESRPEPWASGVRTLVIRIVPDEVTGRRINPA